MSIESLTSVTLDLFDQTSVTVIVLALLLKIMFKKPPKKTSQSVSLETMEKIAQAYAALTVSIAVYATGLRRMLTRMDRKHM